MEVKAIIWDWDGTLVDSFFQCFNTTKRVLSLFGINISMEEYIENFAPNWYKMYENLGLKKEYWETADNLWYKYFDHSCIQWREGALENLSFLKKLGIKQAVVTASTRLDIEKESIYLKPERFIDYFITWEDSSKKKPDPEPLVRALEKLKVENKDIFYTGDTTSDIIMGKNAGVKTIAIPSLFNKKENLIKAKPDYYFENLWDLLDFWKKFK